MYDFFERRADTINDAFKDGKGKYAVKISSQARTDGSVAFVYAEDFVNLYRGTLWHRLKFTGTARCTEEECTVNLEVALLEWLGGQKKSIPFGSDAVYKNDCARLEADLARTVFRQIVNYQKAGKPQFFEALRKFMDEERRKRLDEIDALGNIKSKE